MKRSTLGILLPVLVLSASPSRAQSKADIARADALFTAGKALLDAGQNEDACTKFAESKRLAPGLGVTLYLGDCYERLGRTASAWTEFRSAEGLARDRHDRREEVARTRAEQLEPKLCRLTIAVSKAIPRAGLSILRDGQAVAEDEWGVAIPLDPGQHVVLAKSEGQPRRTFTVNVDADDPRATITVEAPPEAPPPDAAEPAGTTREAPPASPLGSDGERERASADAATSASWSTLRWVGVGVAGVGLAGLGVGTAFGLTAKSKLDQSNDSPCDARNRCTPGGLALRHDAKDAADIATIGMVAGGTLVAAGVVLFLVAPTESHHAGVGMTPVAGRDGGALWVHGRF